RGERGDDARTIDAERRESLQVGLDAGAAAGIGARNGDRDRGHSRPRSASALSMIARNSRAASGGLGASESAEITATPSAPAVMVAAAFDASMPAMAQIGSSARRRRSTCAMRARPPTPTGGSGLSLEVVT